MKDDGGAVEAALPVDQRRISLSQGGVCKWVAALHEDWAAPRDWIHYSCPPTGQDLKVLGAKEAWKERAEFLQDDLDFLLCQPHHVFWSYVLFDSGLHRVLRRLLRHLPRRHDPGCPHPDSDVRGVIDDIMRKTFLIHLRMATHKESPADFFSPAAYGQLIYRHFVFDIPCLLDVCALFYSGNSALVKKMIANVFKHSADFQRDLDKATTFVATALQLCQDRLQMVKDEHTLIDVVVYATDIAVALHNLLKAFPPAAASFSSKDFCLKLTSFYDQGLCAVSASLGRFPLTDQAAELIRSRLLQARFSMLHTFRAIVTFNYLQPVMELQEQQQRQDVVEGYFDILTEVMSDGAFYCDYVTSFPLAEDLDIFRQIGLEVDQSWIQYLQDGGASVGSKALFKPSRGAADCLFRAPPVVPAAPVDVTGGGGNSGLVLESNKMTDCLIGQVRDLLPDLGDGFVQLCLEYFDFQPDKVINAILEDNLPPHLATTDRGKSRLDTGQSTAVLDCRRNVHDGDEFDVNCRTVIDSAKVHRGKKADVRRNANALLNDKTHVNSLKDRFSALGIVTDLVADDELDDEYDDTYDDQIVGEEEPDAKEADDELLKRRPFVTPRALDPRTPKHKDRFVAAGSDQEQEEEESKDTARPAVLDFARNPEEIRAEAERKRAAKAMRRGVPAPSVPKRDVVGAPKGQGQDKQVLINRSRKTANKGKLHRAQAERKMAKGMF